MTRYPVAQLDHLREIGWRDWDPIGLAGCPRDEYDAYLLQVVGRLRRGEPVTQVVDYLDHIRGVTMGLGPPNAASHKASEVTVININAYLDTLPAGPLKIR